MKVTYISATGAPEEVDADIKVRAIPYDYCLLAEKREQFIHTSVYLLEGRTAKEKYKLSSLIREAMAELLPKVKSLSVIVR